jgi:hypothetical protein
MSKWVTEKKQNDHQVTQHEVDDFDALVAKHRKQLQQNRDTTALVEKRAALAAKVGAMTHRYLLRQRRILEEELHELDALIAKRQSGEEEAEGERMLQEFIEKYNEVDKGSSAASEESMSSGEPGSPGAGCKKRVLSGALKKPAATASKPQVLRNPKSTAEPLEKRTYMQDSVRNELVSALGKAPPPVYVVQGDMCEKCNVPMIVLASDALLGCPQCSRTRLYIQATSSRIAYGEEVEFANFSYKRQNHFQEWLNVFQAKESTEVPSSIIEEVMEDLFTKKRIRDVSKINQKKVREVLKEKRLRKYYDHTPQITARITGVLPPRMTPFQAEQAKLMFAAIQGPFNIHCPPDRTNFLSYGYCLYKFCELLGYDEFLPCFTLLKGKDKLTAMDRIWKKICAELDWQFIPSATHLHDGLAMDKLFPS